MYLKKICIVSDVIGNSDVIINRENGFICKQVKEFNKIISNLKEEKKQVEDMRKNAFDNILEIYNTKKMCMRYKEEYILGEKNDKK